MISGTTFTGESTFQVSHSLMTLTEKNYNILLVMKGRSLQVLKTLELLTFWEFRVLLPFGLLIDLTFGFLLKLSFEFLMDSFLLYSALIHLGLVPAQDVLFALILWYVEKSIFRSKEQYQSALKNSNLFFDQINLIVPVFIVRYKYYKIHL